MSETTPASRFFAAYERNIAEGNIGALAAQFAESYLNGSPHGCQILQSADLAAGLPRRRQMLNSLGCGPSRLISLTEIPLGERFVLAQTRWAFEVDGAEDSITVNSSFVLEIGEPVRIVAYIAHQNLVAMLKAQQQESASAQVS
jgi:hypothetical protein